MNDDLIDEDDLGSMSLHTLRRMWKPQRELVLDLRVSAAWSSEPVPVAISRWLESDERREVVIRARLGEGGASEPEVVYVYAHALETEAGVGRLLRVLADKRWLGSRDTAWQVVRACESALHVEREAWIETVERERAEVQAFMGERRERLRAIEAPADAPQLEAPTKKRRKP
jgi:hypothetical protein